jgi:hypothetical protein
MTLQTSGAVPGLSAAWPVHAGGAAADRSCATRLSLARGAMGAAPCKAPEGVGVGGPSADRGSCAPAGGAVAPCPVLAEPLAPRDLPQLPRDPWVTTPHDSGALPATLTARALAATRPDRRPDFFLAVKRGGDA